MAEIIVDYYNPSTGGPTQVTPATPLPVTLPVQPNTLSSVLTFSSSGSSVAQNTVLLSIPDITTYTFFVIQNTSGFSLSFLLTLDGVTFQAVGMQALATPGTWVTTLATATTYSRGIKGVGAQIIAASASSNIYAQSIIQLSAGVGAP